MFIDEYLINFDEVIKDSDLLSGDDPDYGISMAGFELLELLKKILGSDIRTKKAMGAIGWENDADFENVTCYSKYTSKENMFAELAAHWENEGGLDTMLSFLTEEISEKKAVV